MILTEFRGGRVGFFRPKPVCKVGKICPRCNQPGHIGFTTCEVKRLKETTALQFPPPETTHTHIYETTTDEHIDVSQQ